MATPTPVPELSPDELSELLTAHMPEIPGYRVIRRLGQGGMSYVYLGVQESLDRQVAIKVIAPTALKDEISKLRFEREATTIAKLQHPAIVSIHDVGRTELGLLYYVMPYLPRGHLGQMDLREDEPRLLAILRALLWGLDYAHERGIVHRDIKAENVLFDNVDRPLLTDFGIAMYRSDRHRVTDGGFALGSATHMAPEQARGEKVDGRADLYSIGVIAFEKLTGDLPFHAEGPLQMAVRHAVDPVPRLPADKAHWQGFIDRALAKTPDTRFASAQEMMVALDRIEIERAAALAPPEPALPKPQRFAANPVFIAIAACVVLVLAIVVALQAGKPAVESKNAADSETVAASNASATGILVQPSSQPSSASATPAPVLPIAEPLIEDADAQAISDGELLTFEMPADDASTPALDPTLPPDQRALELASIQITRRRLTQPSGDNAHESLLEAKRLGANAARLNRLGEAWLTAAQPYISKAFESLGAPDLRLYEAARSLSEGLELREGEGWKAIEQIPTGWLRSRLRAALQAKDLAALRAAKAQAPGLGLEASALEPEWSQAIVSATPGDRVAGAASLQLSVLPSDARAGLAAMQAPVSRADYARFVQETGHAESNCRARSALLNLRKRRWNAPGFEQSSAQPVVCVSLADAEAYAQWLGGKDRHAYRLPTAAEWDAHIAAGTQQARCESQPTRCESTSIVREWTASCGAGCERQPVAGFGWRESNPGERAREGTVDPTHGYDDVGFRLVRDVPRSELEQR
jgi:serine/threonine-protein kinase PpkA